jgi:hypothetical protein
MLPVRAFDSDPRLQEIAVEMALPELRRTIRYARLRCLSPSDVIARFADFAHEDDLSQYIARLLELKLTASELQLLVTVMEQLASQSEKSRSRTKLRIDRVLLRLVRALPSDLAVRFAEPYLDHPRKGRRRWAYIALREKRISEGVAAKCADSFRRTADQEALILIARNPERVVLVGAEFLLKNLDDKYWRARVLEALIVHNRASALSWSRQYPFEFAHAVGRTGDASLVGALGSLFEANSNDLEFVSIYAYALGKVGAAAELDALDKFVQAKWGVFAKSGV